MVFLKLNDGSVQNLVHINEIKLDGKDIVYLSARGSIDSYIEHFESEESAMARWEDLQSNLLVK